MMSSEQDQLAEVRKQIDEIDDRIQTLINERAGCAKQIAVLKQNHDQTAHYYRPEREAQILRSVQQRNKGPISDDDMARLFREIMGVCLALEKPLSIAFLGPEGTYTHAAAIKHFGGSIRNAPVASIEEVFRLVEADGANFGIVPVENSTEGVINHTLDLFMKSSLNISGEVELRVRHNLLSQCEQLGDIKRVFGHQQTLAQCRLWLNANLGNAERIAVNSNSRGVLNALEQSGTAAIAGEMASELYQLPILKPDIEDEPNNVTRFVIMGKYQAPPSGNDRTSLLIFIHNKPGTLFGLLEPLAKRNISMTNIESRPSRRGVWEYVFFLDIDGHCEDETIKSAIADIEKESVMVNVLGSYPRAVL